jgi:hypothetical protein
MTGKRWIVELHDEFESELKAMDEDVQDALLASAKALQRLGPKAGRPYVDTLKGSKHANMKELRFDAGRGAEVWRAAFAFDPERRAIILSAGAKQGMSQSLFYKRLIKKADARFDQHLEQLSRTGKGRED